MPQLQFETLVEAPIARVWSLCLDPLRVLPAITPPQQQLRIDRVEPLPVQEGTQLSLTIHTPLGPKAWVSQIVEFVPPHGTITGMEGRFVDEQISGPFKRWRHAHELEAVDDRTTRCIDHVTYEIGYRPLGWVIDIAVVRSSLRRIFAYRAQKLKELLA